MKPFSMKSILICAVLITAHAFAQNAPQEHAVFQINRLLNSGNTATGHLSKNTFLTESYQAPYNIEVPYTATEQYTVEAPYTDYEEYQAEVPYTTTESYYENVPYTRNVPYTDYETYYENDYQCRDMTRYRQDCRTETKCHIIPGTSSGPVCQIVEECGFNAQGQRICKTREVCKDGNQGEPTKKCEDKQVCTNVPYSDQVCENVRVERTRTVTKYRSETYYEKELRTRTVTKYRYETRTRQVTKYRSETRTRQVTKYRTEQKCCETKTRQVFDRQLVYNVSVQFPANALLVGGETEVLNINLVSANLQNATVELTNVNTIYGYTIAKQQTVGANIYVELELVPKFDVNNAGPNSIQNTRIDYNNQLQKFQFSFNDTVVSSKVKNTYSAEAYDLTTGAFIEKMNLDQIDAQQLTATMQANLPVSSKIKVVLKVQRTGALIANSGLSFQKDVLFEKRNVTQADLVELKNSKYVTAQLSGQGLNSAITINDATPDFGDVQTEYAVYLDLITGSTSKPINMKKISREQIKLTQNKVLLSDIIQSMVRAKQVLIPGQKISFDMIIFRKGTVPLMINAPIKASTRGSFVIQ